ncbi:hypothetical protein EFE29_09445 [Streptococcus thermophilus]|nr:hypothetical protein [Streptococcus thermophilus]
MACTTILVGKKASYDGSTMIARTEDSQSGVFTPKEFLVITPEVKTNHVIISLCLPSFQLICQIVLYDIPLYQMRLVKTVSGEGLVLTQLMLP